MKKRLGISLLLLLALLSMKGISLCFWFLNQPDDFGVFLGWTLILGQFVVVPVLFHYIYKKLIHGETK